ncbi:MAG TPA: hypothetical protein DF383_00620 [Deltaproteobacteria bacterium]|nr:hypothetical protein [Deltaproteobacteria bacterium]
MLRRVTFFALALGLIIGFSGQASAFGIGNIGNMAKDTAIKTAKGAARGAVANQYNKRLAKLRCRFDSNSASEYSGCNIDKIVSEMSALKTAAESSGFANDVDVIVQTFGKNWNLAQRRAEFLRDKVRSQIGYWDYQIKYDKSNNDEVYFQVSIR